MDFIFRNFLAFLIFLPFVGVIVMRATRRRLRAKWIALGATLLVLLFSSLLPLFYDWRDPANGEAVSYAVRDGAHPGGVVQLVQRAGLIHAVHVQYFVGIDGLSLPLVLLTTLICALVCIASWKVEQESERYFTLVLLAESAILATFLSLDFIFFLLFFAMSWVPIAMLIGRWGGPRKQSAQAKFFIFMLLSSLALLIALIGVFHSAHSFDLIALAGLQEPSAPSAHGGAGAAVFLILMVALVMRLAAFPFHTWLLDAHAAVSPPISMMLCALIRTTGAYGIFRIAYPLFPAAAQSHWLICAAAGLGNIFFGALCAMSQGNLKRLAGFALMPQAGFILLGAAVMTPAGAYGATLIILAAPLTSAMLYSLFGILSDRIRHPAPSHIGSSISMPIYRTFSVIGFLAALGLPMLCTLIGPLLVLLGTFQAAKPDSLLLRGGHASIAAIYSIALLGCIGLLLTSVSVVLALRRIFFGPRRAERRDWPDLDQREVAILTTLAVVAVLLGIIPATLYFTRTTVAALHP